MSITSGIAMFRDTKGEPLGIQIQMSKNWHSATEKWYHLYSNPMLAGPGIDTMELTVAMSRWGQAHAAQHSQLSLIGWTSSRQGGQWQESSISPVGESITYDPDQTLNRAMIDDVRPFLSLGTINVNTKWQWSGNVGGADFLVYVATGTTIKRKLGRVRTNYEAHGPTITNVGFDAISYLNEIQSNIRLQLVSSNDILRSYYTLDYTFLKDVSYERLAFFKIAADGYMDNGFSRYAYTTNNTIADFLNPYANSNNYAKNADRGIPLSNSGSSPWVLLYNSLSSRALGTTVLPEWPAHVGFIVRSYKAIIGNATYTTSHINIYISSKWNTRAGFV